MKKAISTATSTKRIKKSAAGKQLKKKSSGGAALIRQPRAPEKKDSQESRGMVVGWAEDISH